MAQHGLEEHSHGAGVPIQIRHARPKSTSVSDFPAVSKLQEVWKYFPIDKMRGLDQDVLAELSEDGFGLDLAQGVTAEFVDSTHPAVGQAGLPEDRVSAAAWTNASRTLMITVDKDQEVPTPSHIKISAGEAVCAHIIITAKENSEATIVLDHQGQGSLAENIEIITEAGSRLTVISIQDWDKETTHISNQPAKLHRDSHLKHVVVSFGGDVIRVVPSAALVEPGASVEMFGVYLANPNQYIEHRPFVDHNAPNCRSRVTYKGALQGKGAHTVWVGDVLIREAATGTDTYELNRNLLLTDGTRADSVPNLEIETGKIEGAGHASASGRFDDEQLFYLQSRGLEETEARRLVVRGFLNEVIQKIGVEEIQNRLTQAVEAELESMVK